MTLPILPLALCAVSALGATPTYTVLDLGVLPPHDQSQAFGLNERGEVVGWSFHRLFDPYGMPIGFDGNAFHFRKGQMIDLGKFDGDATRAEAINEHGQVVGSTERSSPRHALFWEGGVVLDLGTLGGLSARAVDISDQGHVVGISFPLNSGEHAFLWSAGSFTNLGPIDGFFRPMAVNNSDQVTGPGFVWSDGTRIPVSTLGFDINDLGQIIEAMRCCDCRFCDCNQQPSGSPPNCPGIGQALNNLGHVVGDAIIDSANPRVPYAFAFFWRAGEQFDLNRLIPPGSGWLLLEATDISDAGQICGFGRRLDDPDHRRRAFLLTPINADLDANGSTDLADFARVQPCLVGPGAGRGAKCEAADLDRDGDVDLVDYRSIELGFTGP